MKKIVVSFLILPLMLCFIASAQILMPVKWTWKAEPVAKGEYNLVFTAKVDKGWHVYTQFIDAGDKASPLPTSIAFDKKNTDIKLIGKASETGSKSHSAPDPVWDNLVIKFYENDLRLVQKVKVMKDTRLNGVLSSMACNEVTCTPPDDLEFIFDLKAGDAGANAAIKSPVVSNTDQQKFDSAVQAGIQQSLKRDSALRAVVAAGGNKFGTPQANCGTGTDTGSKGLFAIIILGFLGGLVALVTPCVFPMIPLTVSFFTKRSESKTKGKFEAFFYGFCIVFIYFLLAVPFLIFNISPDTLNEISTGAPLNVFFFFIFAIFAFSFFGFYEIQLPAFIANKADSASNVGGLIGIFFMALTLAIVSFSCTGPIIGSLLVGALSSAGGKLHLVAGMTSFGFALALPFGLFALFPNMMKSLPKSGGWLNSVKVVLGFVELIFAVKFLSNADLVAHWGILKREVFLGLWVLFGAGLFVYLIGKLKFPHDSPVQKLSPVRLSAAALAIFFTIYTAYGIPGNDLHLFSGFPPPKFYSLLKTTSAVEPIKNDYAAALARAKAENKPLMIDFTGWACVNCRKMEENVWPDVEVLKRLSDKYVIVSLYVDDKKQLPDSEQYVSEIFQGKKIKTVGNKFSEMQAKYFGANTQPYYVLVSPNEKLLTRPRGYTPDAKEYVSFLDCGLNAYHELAGRTSQLR